MRFRDNAAFVLQHATFLHPTASLPKCSPCSPGSRRMPFGLRSKTKGVGLIVHAISFQDFQLMWSWSTNVADGQTDRQTDGQTTCNLNTVLFTTVLRAVKSYGNIRQCIRPAFGPVGIPPTRGRHWALTGQFSLVGIPPIGIRARTLSGTTSLAQRIIKRMQTLRLTLYSSQVFKWV